ncbi:B12-binding domain-containing radical SAM protein [Rhizobium laguerreae]|uniref:B12-binding domain-containing radical SAM protein n=1 Tax=Rhizobium laguerreae TaxID=1076926 RepID=UPI001C90E69D|nr:radical SAM protein [Rhizobium laguerreae]MBY3203461.1 radical SAM protein [Rhizobium laguerreae]
MEEILTASLPFPTARERPGRPERILLVFPPFWPPLIPPMGLATLKGRLRAEGFSAVTAIDLNTVDVFQTYQRDYYTALGRWIPKANLGVVGKLGFVVLQNHLLAWINSNGNMKTVSRAVGEFVSLVFYVDAHQNLLTELNGIVSKFSVEMLRKFKELLDDYQPDVLGLSVPGLAPLAAAKIALDAFKTQFPEGLAIVGGSIFLSGLAESPDFERFLALTSRADNIIVGDGIDIFLGAIDGKERLDRILFAVPPGNGPVTKSRVPNPDYTDFDMSRYPYVGTEQTISCPFGCAFCNLPRYHGKYQKRPTEQIADELLLLYRLYGSQLIYMADSILNPIIRDLAADLRQLDVPLYIDGYLRSQEGLGNQDLALDLRRGGLYRARIGVESGSQRVLDLMDKRITVKQSSETVRALAAAGIKTTIYLVVGYPGETDADFQATLEWIDELQNDIWQVDCNAFEYWYSGQCKDDEWARLRMPLYSADVGEILPVRGWTLNCEPLRKDAYARLSRLVSFCEERGIVDPHDMRSIHQADARWQRLHANAVPPLIEFQRRRTVVECRDAELLVRAPVANQEMDAFMF